MLEEKAALMDRALEETGFRLTQMSCRVADAPAPRAHSGRARYLGTADASGHRDLGGAMDRQEPVTRAALRHSWAGRRPSYGAGRGRRPRASWGRRIRYPSSRTETAGVLNRFGVGDCIRPKSGGRREDTRVHQPDGRGIRKQGRAKIIYAKSRQVTNPLWGMGTAVPHLRFDLSKCASIGEA